MTRLSTRGIAYAALGATMLAPLPVWSQVVGVTTAVRNNVEIRQTAASDAKPAVVKQRVMLGNQVDTGGKSSMQVTLLDTSTFTVGPNAEFTINRFVYDPASRRSSFGSSVAKGTFRMLSGKAARGGSNSITTPAATIGIRGTMVEGAVGVQAISIANSQYGFAGAASKDPASATLIVLRGPGPRAQAGERPGEIEVTAGGKSIILNQPGIAVFIPYAGAEPMGPFPLSRAGYSFFDIVLRTAPPAFVGTLASLQTLAAGASARSGAGGSIATADIGTGGSSSGASASGGTGGGAGSAGGAGGGGASSLSLGLLGLAGLIAWLVAITGSDAPSSP